MGVPVQIQPHSPACSRSESFVSSSVVPGLVPLDPHEIHTQVVGPGSVPKVKKTPSTGVWRGLRGETSLALASAVLLRTLADVSLHHSS